MQSSTHTCTQTPNMGGSFPHAVHLKQTCVPVRHETQFWWFSPKMEAEML